jgi:hypothetical protein
MTAPAARGRGVFSGLVRFLVAEARGRGIRALYGTPNTSSGRPYVERLEFVPLWRWRRWLRPVGGVFGVPTSAAAWLASPRRGVEAERLTTWQNVAALRDLEFDRSAHIARDADYLAWRYPLDVYRADRLVVDREPIGLVVTGATRRRGHNGLSVVDAAFHSGNSRVDAAGLRAVLNAARRPEHRVAFSMSRPGSRMDRVMRRAGFVARQSDWQIIARATAPGVSVEDLFGTMAFRAGDSDTV